MATNGDPSDRSRALLEKIRGMAQIPFESPTRGAVVLTRLGYGLPRADSFPLLTPQQRAIQAVRTTIAHGHRHEAWMHQDGKGWGFLFERHVTEGTEQWRYQVEVSARNDGRIDIQDANVVRPNDRDEDEDDDDDRDEDDEEAKPIDLQEAETAGFGMIACPCCGRATLTARGAYQICPVCFWEDDGQDTKDADVMRGGPNQVSLRDGRKNYLRTGSSRDKDLGAVRPPTREEVQLRRFDEDGQEIP
jgi:hypothetical protein